MHSLTQGHRFAQRCSPYVVSAFIYIWHPHSRDTFDDYLSSPGSSALRFNEWRAGHFEEWTTSITLHHWKTAPEAFPEELIDVFSEEKESAHIPPMISLVNAPSNVSSSTNTESFKKLEERSSSIVVSGDMRGDFWTCTILSSSIEEEYMDVYS
jgi:hypothetical protein